jgi:ribosomal protein L16 Arg81 hydroxylase
VRNGRPHPDGEALTAAEARARFEEGYSTVLRHCEEHDEGLCRVATAFERDFGGDVAVHALATPAGFRSFGGRHDCEDAFIVQTSGVKEYRLRPNTVNPAPSIDAMPRNMRFERETTPVFACTLVAGDWLYVPRGFWHVALAVEDSLAISTGVLTGRGRGKQPPRPPAARRFRG